MEFLEAVFILVGVTIGAGILGIPYVVSKAGLLIGIIEIIVIGLAILLLNLYIGEIALRTNGRHQLVGYAERYLGEWGRRAFTATMCFAIYGALTAYILGVGKATGAILGGSAIINSLIFFVLMTIFLYYGLDIIKGYELLFGSLMLGVILIIILLALPSFSISNLSLDNNPLMLFVPYGVIFFAFIGSPAIAEAKEILNKQRFSLKKAIIIGTLIPFFVYLVFTLVVIGITGTETSEVATIALGSKIGFWSIILSNIFAILSMTTGYLALGLALNWVFEYDYGIKKNTAFLLTSVIPLVIAISGAAGFIDVLNFTGAIAGGLEGILIILILRRARKYGDRKPEYVVKNNFFLDCVLIALFVLGALWNLMVL